MGKKGGKGPLPHLRSRTTRSSRGRLIPLQPTPSLPDQLRLLGLYAANTLGDGNCLFRALADQVYGSPVRHAEVRRDVCDWIEKHGERYEGFVEFEGDEGDDEGAGRKGKGGRSKAAETNNGSASGNSRRLQAYLRNMRENGTYGGHMELSAFAHMMRRNIKVVQPGLVYVIEWRAGEPAAAGSGGGGASTSGVQQSTSTKSKSTTMTASAPTSSASGRRRSMRRDSKDGSKTTVEDPDAGKTKHKVGRGYYVLEEVTSDEDDDEDGVEEARWDEQDGPNQGVPQNDSQQKEVLEDAGPTIYVAYHDWEHFSSIRNLRGPHTGLPNIQETPAPPSSFSEYGSPGADTPKLSEKEALKEKEREKKRERERKEKEREKERKEKGAGALKVKLRIPPSSKPASRAETPQVEEGMTPPTSSTGTSTTGTATPAIMPMATSATTTTTAYSSLPGLSSIEPASVPLPTSRSASPFPLPTHLQAELQLGMAAARCASPLRHVESLSASSHQSGYRSPKRSFDESSASASGGEDRDREKEEGGSGSGREEKRLRRRMPSGGGMLQEGDRSRSTVVLTAGEEDEAAMNVDDDEDVDIDVENVDEDDEGGDEVELDTPGLSAPGSSSSSSFSSSLSEVSSSPSPEPGVVVDAASATTVGGDTVAPPEEAIAPPSPVVTTPSKPLKKGTQRYQRQRHLEQSVDGGEQASLTRRQRKALGLPKARKALAGSATKGMSAGKIIIPGGRWTGRELPKTDAAAAAADADADEEWRRNGTGRLDVRGFRELKI